MTLMKFLPFDSDAIKTVGEAHDIAEDRITDFYKFSLGQWKRHHYDVKTLRILDGEEITPNAFALLNRCSRITDGFEFKTKERDFYLICLQDHHIRRALIRDNNLALLPLLVYIFMHELIHIVRFCNFSQRFEISACGRDREERVVHETTYEALKDLPLPKLDYVLASYERHRSCNVSVS